MWTSAGQEAARDPAATSIGARVRALRAAHDWSTREFALRVGVAQAVVSDLEDGARLPTVELLHRLAAALRVPPGELLPAQEDRPRIDVHLPITDAPGAPTAQVIGGGPGNPTQTYLFELRAGESDGTTGEHHGEHRGQELLVVMEGEIIRSTLDGQDEVVRAGRSRVIETRVPHGFRAGDSGPARFLLVCTDLCEG